jgi:hypothetical protein
VADSLAEAAYALALRAIEQQERRLDELRSRAGTLIAAASVAASLLASRAAAGKPDAIGVAALVAYLVCVGCALLVLLPHRLVLEFRGSSMLSAAGAVERSSVEEVLRAAVAWIERFHDRNREEVDRVTLQYTIACAALGVEIVLWTVDFSGRLAL